MAGFIGEEISSFDIADYYISNGMQNISISKTHFCGAFADMFSTPAINFTKNNTEHDSALALRCGDDFAIVGTSISESVYCAVYNTRNAKTQASALGIRNTYGPSAERLKWPLWQGQVEADASYKIYLM